MTVTTTPNKLLLSILIPVITLIAGLAIGIITNWCNTGQF